jgi:hypothetical protein
LSKLCQTTRVRAFEESLLQPIRDGLTGDIDSFRALENFHDLRRPAVRNMRRAGVPRVIRMKISGHKTDSMEHRHKIVDTEDLGIAKEFMERRMKIAESVTEV